MPATDACLSRLARTHWKVQVPSLALTSSGQRAAVAVLSSRRCWRQGMSSLVWALARLYPLVGRSPATKQKLLETGNCLAEQAYHRMRSINQLHMFLRCYNLDKPFNIQLRMWKLCWNVYYQLMKCVVVVNNFNNNLRNLVSFFLLLRVRWSVWNQSYNNKFSSKS